MFTTVYSGGSVVVSGAFDSAPRYRDTGFRSQARSGEC